MADKEPEFLHGKLIARDSRRYFDELAAGWREKYESSRFFKRRRETILALLDACQVPAGRALDYGCGAGVLSRDLACRCAAVVAVDRSPAMRQAARAGLASFPNVTVLAPQELDSAGYDFILCSSVVEYVQEDAAFLRTLADLLQPAGVLLMTFPNRWGPLQMLSRYLLKHIQKDCYASYQAHVYRKSEVQGLAESAGLCCKKVVYEVGLWFLPKLSLSEQIFVVMGKR
jgi:2-polyprenyl-3-methyl-5-hydroxy-6-metoxy-1,4-benzoquinol methylase